MMKKFEEFILVMLTCCPIWLYVALEYDDFALGGILSVILMMIIINCGDVDKIKEELKELKDKVNSDKIEEIKNNTTIEE